METDSQKSAYERYLTERLDSGQSQNIVISTAAELIRKRVTEIGTARVIDIGCFSGAMLERIRKELSPEIQSSTTFVGADIDEEILEIGRRKYQDLDLRQADLTGPIDQLGVFDIVILANIIHETLPENQNSEPGETETLVKQTLDKVAGILVKGGELVILDGLKPNSEERLLILNFKNPGSKNLFLEFSRRYQAFKVRFEDYGDGVITRMKDLTAFLTKARYLHERYWGIETTQNYQYFSEKQFKNFIEECEMYVERFEPQRFTRESLDNMVESIYPAVEFPAKNVLILAEKN